MIEDYLIQVDQIKSECPLCLYFLFFVYFIFSFLLCFCHLQVLIHLSIHPSSRRKAFFLPFFPVKHPDSPRKKSNRIEENTHSFVGAQTRACFVRSAGEGRKGAKGHFRQIAGWVAKYHLSIYRHPVGSFHSTQSLKIKTRVFSYLSAFVECSVEPARLSV